MYQSIRQEQFNYGNNSGWWFKWVWNIGWQRFSYLWDNYNTPRIRLNKWRYCFISASRSKWLTAGHRLINAISQLSSIQHIPFVSIHIITNRTDTDSKIV